MTPAPEINHRINPAPQISHWSYPVKLLEQSSKVIGVIQHKSPEWSSDCCQIAPKTKLIALEMSLDHSCKHHRIAPATKISCKWLTYHWLVSILCCKIWKSSSSAAFFRSYSNFREFNQHQSCYTKMILPARKFSQHAGQGVNVGLSFKYLNRLQVSPKLSK